MLKETITSNIVFCDGQISPGGGSIQVAQTGDVLTNVILGLAIFLCVLGAYLLIRKYSVARMATHAKRSVSGSSYLVHSLNLSKITSKFIIFAIVLSLFISVLIGVRVSWGAQLNECVADKNVNAYVMEDGSVRFDDYTINNSDKDNFYIEEISLSSTVKDVNTSLWTIKQNSVVLYNKQVNEKEKVNPVVQINSQGSLSLQLFVNIDPNIAKSLINTEVATVNFEVATFDYIIDKKLNEVLNLISSAKQYVLDLGYLSPAQQADFNEKIENLINEAKDRLNNCSTPQELENILQELYKKIDDTRTQGRQDCLNNAKLEVDSVRSSAIETIRGLSGLTDDEIDTYISNIDTLFDAFVESLEDATTKAQIDELVSNAKDAINKLVNDATLISAKANALAEVDTKTEAAINAINALDVLSDEVRAVAINSIQESSDKCKMDIEDATNVDQINSLVLTLNNSLDKIVNDATALKDAKILAWIEVGSKNGEASNTIRNLTELSETEKSEALSQIKELSDKCALDIDAALTVPDIESLVTDFNDAVNGIVSEATQWNNAKLTAFNKVNSKADEAINAIEALSSLSQEEIDIALALVEEKVEKCIVDIKAATTQSDIDNLVKGLEESLDAVVRDATLKNSKNIALAQADDEEDVATKLLTKLTSLSEQEKIAYSQNIKDNMDKFSSDLENATTQEEVDSLIANLKASLLLNARTYANKENSYEEVANKQSINKLIWLSNEERAPFLNNVTNISQECQQALNGATDILQVTQVITSAQGQLSNNLQNAETNNNNKREQIFSEGEEEIKSETEKYIANYSNPHLCFTDADIAQCKKEDYEKENEFLDKLSSSKSPDEANAYIQSYKKEIYELAWDTHACITARFCRIALMEQDLQVYADYKVMAFWANRDLNFLFYSKDAEAIERAKQDIAQQKINFINVQKEGIKKMRDMTTAQYSAWLKAVWDKPCLIEDPPETDYFWLVVDHDSLTAYASYEIINSVNKGIQSSIDVYEAEKGKDIEAKKAAYISDVNADYSKYGIQIKNYEDKSYALVQAHSDILTKKEVDDFINPLNEQYEADYNTALEAFDGSQCKDPAELNAYYTELRDSYKQICLQALNKIYAKELEWEKRCK